MDCWRESGQRKELLRKDPFNCVQQVRKQWYRSSEGAGTVAEGPWTLGNGPIFQFQLCLLLAKEQVFQCI